MIIDSDPLKAWLSNDTDYHQDKRSQSNYELAKVQHETFMLAYKKVLNKIAELEQKQLDLNKATEYSQLLESYHERD